MKVHKYYECVHYDFVIVKMKFKCATRRCATFLPELQLYNFLARLELFSSAVREANIYPHTEKNLMPESNFQEKLPPQTSQQHITVTWPPTSRQSV